MARTTISDVAKLAGVSEATVSRAMRGATNVSPATQHKVEEAANALHFTLSKSASALASGKTGRVLLLVSGALNIWFNASVLRGVHDVLAPAGYDVIPSYIMNKPELDRYFQELPKNRNADAIIISSFLLPEEIHHQMRATDLNMPIIGLSAPSTKGFDASVSIDNANGMQQAVSLLRALGHQRIAFVGDFLPDDMLYSTTTRAAGFLQAAEQAGYSKDDVAVIRTSYHDPEAEYSLSAPEAAAKLLACPIRPTGVCVETDEFAALLVKELRKQHVRLPEDMSLIGFDDAPIGRLCDLTTIHQDPVALGHEAAMQTLTLMQGQPLANAHITHQPQLVLRSTTAAYAGGNAAYAGSNTDEQ